MSKPYRIGIIGVGSMGRHFFNVLRESPRWDLVWAYNRTRGAVGRQPGRDAAHPGAPQASVIGIALDLVTPPAPAGRRP